MDPPCPPPSCTLANAAWQTDPYPFYAALRKRQRAHGLFLDAATGLWVACTAAAVREALQHPALRVRPAAEPVPRPLAGRPSGRLFGGLMRMNDGPMLHDRPKAAVQAQLAALPPRVAQLPVPAANPRDVNALMFDAPLLLLAALLDLPEPLRAPTVRHVRELVGGWGAGADAAALQRADVAADALLARFDGDANRIGLFTQTCDATAALLGIALTAWQARPGTPLDADSVAALARRDAPIQNTRRFVAEPLTLCGRRLSPGDGVLVVLASASHDAGDRVAPPGRDAGASTSLRTAIGWGAGPHACPGERLSHALVVHLLRHWLAADPAGWRAATARWRYRPSPNARLPEFLA